MSKHTPGAGPALTLSLHMHVNGGSKFSRLVQRVHADGEPTEIFLLTETDGSPHYYITAKELQCGDDAIDLMAVDRPDPIQWIRDRLIGKEPNNPGTDA